MTSDDETGSRLPSATAQKRKLSSDETGKGRTTKYRSSQACQSCRIRKVRCDVLTNGFPCTNCRLDDTECFVLASRRGKTNKKRHESADNTDHVPRGHSSRTPAVDEVNQHENTGGYDDITSHEASMPTPPVGANDVPVCVTFDEDSHVDNQPRASEGCLKDFPNQSPSASRGARDYPNLEGWHTDQADSASHPSTSPNFFDCQQESARKIVLPTFIAPIPTDIPIEDLEFLTQKGAFAIPEPELCIEILNNYMFSVHPFMPILDRPAILDTILKEVDNDNRISLLLFQAVMFAGLASIDLHSVHAMGFKSTKHAREVFFHRVRLLYEFGIEPNEEFVFQSLLLMSSWYDRNNQRRDTWHWTGLALSVAQTMGLHREPTPRCGPDRIQHLRRRLWWSLYIRDRLLALGTRRPMRIRDDSFNVTMLTLDDFDVHLVCESDQGRSLTPDVEETTRLALMCIELAKLSICIGNVLSSQYTTLKTQPDVSHTMAVVPQLEGDRTPKKLEECDREINEWYQALGPVISISRPPSGQDALYSCSGVHMGILNMVHLTLINVLYRTQALGTLTDKVEVQVVQKASRSKVKDAACKVTKITYAMLRRDQVRFLGVAGVTALLAACLSHMLDIRLGDDDLRDASIFRFYQSMQVLQSLSGIYTSADSSVSFLASVIRKAGIPVPAQVAAPAPDFMSASTQGFNRLTTPLGNNKWKATTASPQKRAASIADGQPRPTWWKEQNTSQSPLQSTRSYSQSSVLMDMNQAVPSNRNVMMPSRADTFQLDSTTPYASGYSVSSNKDEASIREQISQPLVTSNGDPRPTGANLPLFNWSTTSTDINLMAFNDEFYSDTFGILQSQFQDLQPIAYNKDFGENAFGSLIP